MSEMPFRFEWWTVLAIVLYLVAILAGAAVALDTKMSKDAHKKWRVCLFLTVFTLVAGVFNILTYSVSASNSNAPLVTGVEVASHGFGLKSNEKYPLVVGSRLGSVRGASFSARVSSGSILSIDFTGSNGVNYVLELPVNEIDFIIDEDPDNASVILKLDGRSDRTYGPKQLAYEGPCKVIVQSGYMACDRVLEWETIIPQYAIDAGLPNIVSDIFSHAIITLPCTEYREVLGVNGRLKYCGG